MITEEYFAKLGRVRNEFTWKLMPDDSWASERRGQARLRARASHRTLAADSSMLDPIGAVCYAVTQELYEPEYWQDAANAIELSLISASDLIAAANDRTWKGKEGRREPDEYLLSLRRRLIETVGLQLP